MTEALRIKMNKFITTWKTDNLSASGDKRIDISTTGSCHYMIDWGDGQVDNDVKGSTTHKYDSAGTYTVEISGAFPRFCTVGHNNQKLLSVEQWGDIEWQSMQQAFYNCTNLVVNATDVPDLSRVTDMSFMFYDAKAFNQNISGWDVSSVTDMAYMFNNAYAFNQDISGWDVSSVKDGMSGMFNNARAFNQDISGWDVSAVTKMDWMFNNAHAFNQDISGWDVSAVTDMLFMFSNANVFNQDISGWDVSLVKDMRWMFCGAKAFKQDISGWNVSSVTKTQYMFDKARDFSFNKDCAKHT